MLFFNIPGHGHVNPTLPLVRELVQRGHTVRYYDTESFRDRIEACEAEFQSYPDSETFEAEFTRRVDNLVHVTVFLFESSFRLLPFVLDEITQRKPDLVLFDSIALWGKQATQLLHIPSVASISTFVQEGVSGMTFFDYVYVLRQAIPRFPALLRGRRRLVRTYGPDVFPGKVVFPCTGTVNIVYTSRAFQPETPFVDDSFHFVGPSILASTRPSDAFPWEWLDEHRPHIYVSLGTLHGSDPTFFRTTFRAFADHPGQFILSTGEHIRLEALGSIPDNFLVRPTVPQLELLTKMDAFISQGGMNSVNESLYFGVPLVVVPRHLEQVLNGRQVVRQGAGLILGNRPPYGRVKVKELRRAVEEVLSNRTYAEQATRLSRSFQEAGGYQQAATVVTALLE